MGTGIWAMHYVGMEAFHLPVPLRYDWPTVLLSLIVAILSSGLALFTVSRPTMGNFRMTVAGLFMGCGIAAMHYIGMEAMRLRAMCTYSPWLVGISIVLSIAISLVALHLTFSLRNQVSAWNLRKLSSALIMGLAIPTMHYVGMAAATFVSMSSMNGSVRHAIDVSGFAVLGTAAVSILILSAVFLTAIVDRQFSLQAQLLATSELQLQTVFDNMSEGIMVLDRYGRAVLLNKAAIRLLSIPEETPRFEKVIEQFDVLGPNGELVSPENWPSMRALRGDFVQDCEVRFRRKSNGEIGAREITTASVGGVFGDSAHVIITYRDITERARIDEARARLAAIVESSDDAIISKTDQGIVTSWNRGAEALFGYTSAEMIGQSITRLIPDDRAEEENDILGRIRRGEKVDHIETLRKTKHGHLIHVSLTISPLRDGSGRIVGASKIARNITERKHLERQLRQGQKMEAIGQLTGGIAHDFNNLLGIVLGNLDLLGLLLEENEEALKRVRTAETAALRGADLIRRLMSFSSNVELKAAATSLNASIRNLVDWAPTLGPDISIRTQLDDSLPPVFADETVLESALLNLAVNARDAMPNGGTITISTELAMLEEDYMPVRTGDVKPGRYACISISDTGHGMSPETMERAFEPFFTTKPRDKGTGLGLAMVYGFAKQSGGTVRLYSEINFGTTVSLYLPLFEGKAEAGRAAVSVGAPSRLSGTALVVDDEEGLVEIAIAYLNDMGYATYHARDSASALAIVERHKDIDLILTDILMPGGMNGVALAEKIRELIQPVKVIYCSGFPANALSERVSLVDGPLLRKPYQRAEFAAAVRAVMEG